MHKKGYDKKVALKLINQYADQYNRISEENKCIRMQLKDLQSNIAINKQIIETFFSSIPIEQKVNKLLLQYKEENKVLLSSLSNLSNENEKMVKKVKYYEGIINKSITEYRESTDSLKDKIFILENSMIKKQNEITLLNNQIKKMQEEASSKNKMNLDNTFSDEDKKERNEDNQKIEVYVIDPTMSVNLIQGDLTLYKQAYENALMKIKEGSSSLEKSEKIIEQLKNEIYKMQSNSYHSPSYNNKSPHTENMSDDVEEIKLDEILSIASVKKNEIDILAQTNIGLKVLILINKTLSEYKKKLSKCQEDINFLLEKNKKVTSENMTLYKSVLELKKNSYLYKNNTNREQNSNFAENYLNTNISMIGNTSREKKRKKTKKGIQAYFTSNTINTEKVNQSADDISVELTTNEEVVRKNNLTDISGDFLENYNNNIIGEINNPQSIKKN